MIRTRLNRAMLIAAAMLLPLGAMAQTPEKPAAEKQTVDPYPLTTCPVTGKELGAMGDPLVKVYDGREVRFCCAGCPAKFEADPEKYWKQIDADITKQQDKSYPLDTCVVSGEKLGGDMGEPVQFMHKNHLVKLCCKGCKKDFDKDPDKYIKMIDAARKAKGPASKSKAESTTSTMGHMHH